MWPSSPFPPCDAQGRSVPVAQIRNKVNFAITGGGRIIGVGNGDPNCTNPRSSCRQPTPHRRRRLALAACGRSPRGNAGLSLSLLPVRRLILERRQNRANFRLGKTRTAVYRARVKLTQEISTAQYHGALPHN
jgi:hypothetical protein